MERQIDSVMSGTNQKAQDIEHATIFSEILQSKRPQQEKSKKRLHDEAQTIVSAGIETTAWTLSVITCYLLCYPEILKTLRKELEDAWINTSVPLDLPTLEALPYLTAVIQEGMFSHCILILLRQQHKPSTVNRPGKLTSRRTSSSIRRRITITAYFP
jgi:cytochrome P450